MKHSTRRHVAAAVTVVASLVSLASLDSNPTETYTSAALEGPPIVLTDAAPSAKRTLRAAVASTDARAIGLSVSGTVAWSGAAAGQAADAGQGFGDGAFCAAKLGPLGATAEQAGTLPGRIGEPFRWDMTLSCEPQLGICSRDFELDVVLLRAPPGAEVTITWTAVASVVLDVTTPAPASVTVTLLP